MPATVSTHVLDTARGTPGAGISIGLFALNGERKLLNVAVTGADGRTNGPLAHDLPAGMYELVFAVMDYFELAGVDTFFDEIPIRFRIDESTERYHVPLLLSPWGYTAYRGS
ncbi:MAG TPA: hydroxyisourate hydrolase [Candidatus Elarobacter sp.]|jgi:5-hydroxyisourate hydrolase|nr:hydroxyisourate hydrolase [Candidatus Elarobacter sp.]